MADLTWDAEQKIALAQAQMFFPPATFRQFADAKPAENKPVYILAEDLPEPLMIKIAAIEEAVIDPAAIEQVKLQLMQGRSLANTEDALNYLKRTVKVKAGHQKLDGE